MDAVGIPLAIQHRRARRRVRRHRTLGSIWRGFTYDANGNLDQVTDALSRVTDQNVDPLNRLSRTLQDTAGLAAQTQVAYDALDNPTQVTDPKGLNTTYAYTGFSEPKTLTSPDTGTATYTYDAAGNRASQVDARSKTTNSTYDALNRPTTVTYPTASALNVAYVYDTAQAECQTGETFTIGRLAKMSDGSGSTVYCYDRFGALVRKVQTTNGQSFTLRYAYAANGQLQKTIYPDLSEASYLYDAQGRTQEINVKTATGTTIQLLRSASYHPFGPVQQWTYGNGRVMTRTLNLNGEPGIVQVNATDGLSLGYEFDEVGNLKALRNGNQSDPPLRLFGYDALSRLTETKDGGTNAVLQSYAYDATGNRTSATVSGTTTTNTYDAASHRLTQVGANARTYDTAGNTTQIAGTTAKNFVYGDHNRMTQALNGATVAMNYVYNGLGERVRKYLSTANTYTMYDEAGRWIGDYGNAGGTAPTQQVIWFDDLPVGVLDGAGANQKLHYIEPDALGTPRVVIDRTRGAQGVAIWRWDLTGEAFGATAPNQDPDGDATAFVFDMRFPGQRYDAASGLNYNYFREYEPGTGRYSQSDPIGLAGGVNTYGYVANGPTNASDPLGLFTVVSRWYEMAGESFSARNARRRLFMNTNEYKYEQRLEAMGKYMQEVINKKCQKDRNYIQPIFDRWVVKLHPTVGSILPYRADYALTEYATGTTEFTVSAFDQDGFFYSIGAHEFRHTFRVNHALYESNKHSYLRARLRGDDVSEFPGERDADAWADKFWDTKCGCTD